MNVRATAAALSAALLAAAAPLARAADEGDEASAPVTLNECRIEQRETYTGWTGQFPPPITLGLRLVYTSTGAPAAREILFEVEYRGENQIVKDVGTFSNGKKIAHLFRNFGNYAYLGSTPNLCRVIAVRYVDGSLWTSPRRQQSLPTPTPVERIR